MFSNTISVISGNAPPGIPLTLNFLNLVGTLEQLVAFMVLAATVSGRYRSHRDYSNGPMENYPVLQ